MTFLIPTKKGVRRDIFSEFESFFNPEQFSLIGDSLGEEFIPSVNIESDDQNLYISVATPGYKKEEIKIEFENSVLKISGETKAEDETKSNQDGQRVLHSEIKLGNFARSIKIGNDVDVDKAKADYNNGVLKISIPKVEEAQPKRLLIG